MRINKNLILILVIAFVLFSFSACTPSEQPPADKPAAEKPAPETKTPAPAEPAAPQFPVDQAPPESPAEHVIKVKIDDSEVTLTKTDIIALDAVKDYEMETHGKVNGVFQTVYPVMKGISLTDLLASQGYTGGATELYMGGVDAEPARKPLEILEREKVIIALSRDGSWNDPASKVGTFVLYMEGDMGPTDKVTAEDGTVSKATINNVNYIEVKTK